ncbi:hypothetical protein [Sphingomonas sp. 1P08PE]|uniref:hypothetical protein n=1 Tax=Sphingomonas sp. 1P08PE TaxID=554122 RepID=UPI0039A1BC04
MSWLLIDSDTHEIASGPYDDEPEATEGVYATAVMFGWPETVDWVPAMQGFVRKPAPEPLTRLAFQRLFTQAERIAIRTSTDMIVQDFMALSALAVDIDLADPDVVMGVGYLESVGLIGEGRAAAITAGQAPA